MKFSVIKGLNAVSNSAIRYGLQNVGAIPEFCALAKELKIFSITRTAYYENEKGNTEIYKDSTFAAVYTKEFERRGADVDLKYIIEGEIDYFSADDDTRDTMELLTNVLCLCYNSCYLYSEAKRERNIDRDSGIPNENGLRIFFEDILEEGMLDEYAIAKGKVKGGKLLNNVYGYNTTSDILNKYAARLSKTVSKDEICARLDGDTFLLMLKKNRLKNNKDTFGEIEVEFSIGYEQVVHAISLKAGIAELTNEDTLKTAMAHAAIALDFALNNTATDVVYYDSDDFAKDKALSCMENDLPAAIENEEFEVFYQPKVRIDNRTMIGAEALVRWDRDGVMVSPDEFIPMAERTELIKRIDLYVLEQTCRLIAQRLKEGKEVVPISVNFSKIHLKYPHFADRIMNIIEKYKIPPYYIEVEFTETAYVDDFGCIKQAIDDLKKHGVMASMDDFGTGYSSLSLLKNINIDVIKVDKSLSNSDDEDKRGAVVLENVLNMANELNLVTVCEGVESKGNMESLYKMGCKIIQGYCFDKPLPEDEFFERMDNPVYK